MNTMIDNLINGNLADARRQARPFTRAGIAGRLVRVYGWTERRAYLAARYLKTGAGFQEYCDAN